MLKKLLKISGFKLSLLVTFLMAGLFFTNLVNDNQASFFNLMDKKVIDYAMKSRGTAEHGDEVVMAVIDTKSVDKYGRWPWPRSYMAKLVHELQTYYKVNSIGFDIVFSEDDTNYKSADQVLKRFEKAISSVAAKDRNLRQKIHRAKVGIENELNGDAKFGAELSRWDNVVMGYFFFGSGQDLTHLSEEEIAESASRIQGSEIQIIQGLQHFEDFQFQGAAVESNIPILMHKNSMNGYFSLYPDGEDGTIRRVHLVLKYKDQFYPSLDLQLLKYYYGNQPIRLVGDEVGVAEIHLGGDKVIYTNSDGSISLNYKGPAKTFAHHSVYDILNHKIPKEELQGKIVLVGATEMGIFDLRTTPVGEGYPGVEVHANVVENIIHDDYFNQSEEVHLLSILLILFVGLLMGILVPRMGALKGAVFSLVLLLGYFYANLWFVYEQKTWASFVYIIVTILANWFALTLYRFLVEEKDKRFIKGAFQQYLSPDVIEQLVDDPNMLKLGGERKELTAFFSDVQGFSTISESLEPEELVELLNEYLTEMTDIIMRHGGTVDKFEGDAIIAFFGAPLPYEDHAARACLASLEMQAKLAEMRATWKEEGKHQLYQRIGLNTGSMVVGNMGSKTRMDYTMMGDAVNLAARLEGVNKQYKTFLMISEFTHNQVKDQVEVRELDMIRVVGKKDPVRIYEVLCKKGELPENTVKAFKYYLKGLQLYRKKEWMEAAKYFAQTAKMVPNDGPSLTYIERCKMFKDSPPPENWDGVFQMTSK